MSMLLSSLLLAAAMPPVITADFEFVLQLDQVWIVDHGATWSFGNLDRQSDFTPIPQWANIDPTGSKRINFKYGFLNPARTVDRPEKVYEFRSDRLIPGQLEKDGHFVPDLDGKILPFKDYKYVPKKSRRIYNLPGSFVRKQKPTGK